MRNYNKMSKNNKKPETKVVEPEIIETKGIVVECEQLYVRSEADKNSEPLGIVKKNTKVVVETEESTEDFYKVCTEAGLEGFCMKQFVKIV